ncbi:MAG: 2,3-diaminopropionate biosynthesis protein SbnA [Acidobacteria bacterium]|nr:MAG: 2,3-diaminopropionate biosynthesis protein SbnA [Acidobacteriota bacterium]
MKVINEWSTTDTVREGVLLAIGNTPLVRLKRVCKDIKFNLYAKLEMLNPGGSIKDRTAISILEQGIRTGLVNRNTVIIESSSGNMGVGLAQACSFHGLKFICVVDAKTTAQNTRILRAYGAEIVCIDEPDPETGEYLKARIDRVEYLLRTVKNSFWPNQYANVYNPRAHHRTMHEITTTLGGRLDYLFCATSTCGTLRGCAEYVKQNKLPTKIIAVDAVGSVIFGGQKAKRLIPGHGAAITPPLFQSDLAHQVVHVTDLDCVVGCRRLARCEAILAGGSSGAVITAVTMMSDQIPRDAMCGIILPDRGERYLDTIYSNQWVEEHFGDVAYNWEEYEEECVAIAS